MFFVQIQASGVQYRAVADQGGARGAIAPGPVNLGAPKKFRGPFFFFSHF